VESCSINKQDGGDIRRLHSADEPAIPLLNSKSRVTHTTTSTAPTHAPIKKAFNKISRRGRRDDMPPPADGRSTVAKIAADLRPSADGSAVRASLVAGGG